MGGLGCSPPIGSGRLVWIHSDCSNVTNAHGLPLQDSLRHNLPYAGIVRSTLSDPGRSCVADCVKVKAHLKLNPDMDDLLRRHVIFNDKADHFAKQGAKLHDSPSEEVDSKWQSDLTDLKSFAKL
eukprot:1693773-Heterocapsa_arctica.AAC.1